MTEQVSLLFEMSSQHAHFKIFGIMGNGTSGSETFKQEKNLGSQLMNELLGVLVLKRTGRCTDARADESTATHSRLMDWNIGMCGEQYDNCCAANYTS